MSGRTAPEELLVPSVLPDNVRAGELAAEYLIGMGHRGLAIWDREATALNKERAEGFQHLAEQRGLAVHKASEFSFKVDRRRRNDNLNKIVMRQWLASLATPGGVLVDDINARRVFWAAEELQLAIPEDLALLGVNNDMITCEMLSPPLSSVDLNARKIGSTAASLLVEILQGHRPCVPGEVTRVPPLGVVERASSARVVADDPLVTRALETVRENMDYLPSVTELAEQLAVSRRTLERAFGQAIGRSPASEIRRLHLEQARHLLATTDTPLTAISARVGFRSYQHFAKAFRKAYDHSPAEFRKEYRVL